MCAKAMTRADDDKVLAMLAMRRKLDCQAIATRFDMTQEAVRTATNRVVGADTLAEGRDTLAEYRFLPPGLASSQGIRRAQTKCAVSGSLTA